MVDHRLEKIFHAASRLFINPGYAQTQVDHIVKACGISVGAVYDLFSGKKAILKFILKCVLDPDYIERDFELPITEDQFAGLEDDVTAFFAEKSRAFAEPLKNNAADYPFSRMLSDAFDTIQTYGVGLLILEKNPKVFGKLFTLYTDYRRRFFQIIVEYLTRYTENGTVRLVAPPQLSAMFIIEAMTWWGVDITYDSFEPRDDVSADTAKAVCTDTLLAAYQL
ncbi:TetR/AcrR family transcriptional regulator [Breznakiella homolactica]|uniref:TetR/AcrR family transcriptional regulator n=1 Tax=Breznakiella homolactica TaxID=2798577 RepID=A0A7T7XL73_9SPIR|nr:TetR/AcrR family transcriptional regulator [Breznakiella homolactica]QQO08445.1 TetR/AcrR family transcriptional regulator [Breznakiella homolactica]